MVCCLCCVGGGGGGWPGAPPPFAPPPPPPPPTHTHTRTLALPPRVLNWNSAPTGIRAVVVPLSASCAILYPIPLTHSRSLRHIEDQTSLTRTYAHTTPNTDPGFVRDVRADAGRRATCAAPGAGDQTRGAWRHNPSSHPTHPLAFPHSLAQSPHSLTLIRSNNNTHLSRLRARRAG